ncbi:ABC transporter substrate-binding protein [Kumtagia ephedrae]|uniref:Amino acid ABC transporter substrate-binding protein n=1 Tax=Kumtagia ephedrae TaxID=2116701 RepID=A0A2P7SAG9_9HYPH|nr:ABC transporter substrate-binding protein [Mesorhizobium ephedrae]PSJ59502.1 amino acid ABC transporter substrate-binding protein [Mesorhizobium ephedrae]
MGKLVLGAAALAAGLMQAASAGADDLKIGLAVAMTGTYAPYSEAEGARCMADRINKAADGGPKIELMIEDNRSDPQLSVSLGQKFLDAGAQVITGVPFPDALIPTAQIAEPYGATVFSAPNTQLEMQQAGLDNFIAGAVPDPINAAAVANALYGKGALSVALLVSPDAGSYSEKLPEWFGEVFEHLGGKVVTKLNYSWGTTDWSPQIASIKALPEKPDAIHVCGVLPDVGILLRQLRANGYDGWVAGCDAFDDKSLEGTVGDAASLDKVMFATHGATGMDSPIDQFLEQCKADGYKVNGIFDALGADMVQISYEAAKKAGTTEAAALREAMRAPGGYPGTTAPVISFAEKKGYPVKAVPVIGFAEGNRVLITDTPPTYVPALD